MGDIEAAQRGTRGRNRAGFNGHRVEVRAGIRFFSYTIRMQRFILIFGILLVVLGLLWPWITKIGLGRLPGDLVVRRENFQFYFPVTTCLLLSGLASLLFWLFRK